MLVAPSRLKSGRRHVMSDRRYWVMRTDPDNRDVLLAELRAGRLRQGWGYEPHLDLNVIAAKLERHGWRVGELEEDERACWRGNQRMWPGHWGAINVGDLIVVPKMPVDRHWMIVEVVGAYRFDLREELGDYGHLLPVEVRAANVSNSKPCGIRGPGAHDAHA